jgi:hypothetical protein
MPAINSLGGVLKKEWLCLGMKGILGLLDFEGCREILREKFQKMIERFEPCGTVLSEHRELDRCVQ